MLVFRSYPIVISIFFVPDPFDLGDPTAAGGLIGAHLLLIIMHVLTPKVAYSGDSISTQDGRKHINIMYSKDHRSSSTNPYNSKRSST